MSQETINILLAVLTIAMPSIQYLVNKYFSRNKDVAEYSTDLLQVANTAAEQLRKTREDMTRAEQGYEKQIEDMRKAGEAAMQAIRTEYDARHERLKNRITELEKVTKVYAIQFDLVTHPNVELKNIQARAMDDTSASQKIKAISEKK